MSRLQYLTYDQLDEQGQALWDSLLAGRGSSLVTQEHGLAGPFNAWLHAPDVGTQLGELGSALRFRSSLERRLLEIAIITVGARWRAEFEWWAHAAMARRHGVADPVVDAIGRGEPPPFEAEDERVVHRVAQQLADAGQLDAPTYAAAHDLLGDQGLVELVSLCGYYTLVSWTLNAFAVPLPPDATPMWPDGAVQ
jgi:4-carboxymuconolactone decarboxylase